MGDALAVTLLLIPTLLVLLLPARLLRGLDRRLILLATALASVLLVAWTLWGRDRPWVAELLPGPALAIVGNWSLPLAALVVGCAHPALPGPWWRRTLLAATCLGLAGTASLGFLLAASPDCANQWEDGVCLQTTASTCSAAAAATLLARNDVAATEGQLAAACFSGSSGTTLHGLVGGLRRFAPPGRRVRVAMLDSEALASLGAPAILSVMLDHDLHQRDPRYARDWGWIVGQPHSVVLEGFDHAGFPVIADPANGRERWHLDTLPALWSGRAVWLEVQEDR